MKPNENKCHVLLSNNENVHVNIGTVQIRNSSSGKLLFIKIDFKLNFKDRIGSICKKDSSKLNVLLIRNWGSMDPDKRRLIVNAFVSSEFVYRPLAGMFYSREFCHQINGLREKSLRVIYHDTTYSFDKILQKDNFVSID